MTLPDVGGARLKDTACHYAYGDGDGEGDGDGDGDEQSSTVRDVKLDAESWITTENVVALSYARAASTTLNGEAVGTTGVMSGNTAQTNWLGELLLHGQDVARAVKAPWQLPEREMLLVLRGGTEMVPLYLRRGVCTDTNACVAFQIPEARPYLIHIHGGTTEMRERRPNDRPDAVLRVPASTLTQLLYQRIGPLTAVRRGLRIVGGRRPWVALKAVSYFERP